MLSRGVLVKHWWCIEKGHGKDTHGSRGYVWVLTVYWEKIKE